MKVRWLTLAAIVLAGCAGQPSIDARAYRNLGRLREVRVYDEAVDVSAECVKRTGGKADNGSVLSKTNACADGGLGVVLIAATASVRDFLHELCHVEGLLTAEECGKLFPGDQR